MMDRLRSLDKAFYRTAGRSAVTESGCTLVFWLVAAFRLRNFAAPKLSFLSNNGIVVTGVGLAVLSGALMWAAHRRAGQPSRGWRWGMTFLVFTLAVPAAWLAQPYPLGALIWSAALCVSVPMITCVVAHLKRPRPAATTERWYG